MGIRTDGWLLAAMTCFVALLPAAADAALVVSNATTSNVNCTAEVCTATAANAVLNAKDLKKFLQKGDLKLASGSVARDIEFDATVKWIRAFRLTADAYRSIFFNAPVVAAGGGGLTITTDDGGTGGDFVFVGKGHVEFWDTGSSLIINGTSFTLVRDINSLAAAVKGHPSGFYALAGDYDASVDGTYPASPISDAFGGIFEGLGNGISHFSLHDTSTKTDTSDGLFAQTTAHARIRDIALTAIKTSGGGNGFLGGLVGQNFGAIAHVKIQGSLTNVKWTALIGGVVGQNYGPISDASFDGTISGIAMMGGIAAWNYQSGTIDSSDTSGVIKQKEVRNVIDLFVGGLAAANNGIIRASRSSSVITSNVPGTSAGGLVGGSSGSIALSSATGNVTLATGFGQVGGLVGFDDGIVDQSFATGAVAGGDRVAVGGLIGENERGNVLRSFSTGSVTAGSFGYCGGLVGDNASVDAGQITEAYSTGDVSAGQEYLGGLVGYDASGASTTGYWDLDTSGISNPANGAGNITNDPGIVGLTDAQLKSGLPNGFNPTMWGQSATINNGYPYLLANPPQ